MEQSTNGEKIAEGKNIWGQYRMHLDASKKQSSAMSGLDVKSCRGYFQYQYMSRYISSGEEDRREKKHIEIGT